MLNVGTCSGVHGGKALRGFEVNLAIPAIERLP